MNAPRPLPSSPEVTVSMPAYNAAPFIRQALHSVLSQEDIDVEIIVVDDASTDGTAGIVESIDDPRVRLIRHAVNRGPAASHNSALAQAAAPVVAVVDADDILLPGALRKLVDAVTADPRVGQAHCHFIDIDVDGRVHREELRARVARFRAKRRPPLDYRRRLAVSAGIINHLRTYRTDVLRALGGFDERLRHGEDYDMALRVLEHHEIALVPEYLYCWRRHPTGTAQTLSPLRRWLIRFRIRRRVVREARVTYLRRTGLHLVPVLRAGARSLGRSVAEPLRRVVRRSWPTICWLVLRRMGTAWYRAAISASRLLPFHLLFAHPRTTPAERRRVAYCLGGFPVLSETFVQREIEALEAAGVPLTIFAREPRGGAYFDDRARRLMERTRYVGALDAEVVRRRTRHLMLRHPLRFLACRAYVTSCVHGRRKTPRRDAEVFRNAVRLAAALDADGIAHVHSAWANRHAFEALLAAALLNIPYSVQARAYDIHREAALALDHKLAHARFVITNTQYNADILRARLPIRRRSRLHVVYNGIDLDRVPDAPPPFAASGPCRLLFVGRLVEQKGIEYLLRACDRLRREGRSFSCVILGDRTAVQVNYYVQVRKLLRSLALDPLVAFVGARPPDEVMRSYGNADLVVLPAVVCADGSRDVTPNVLLEAMAMRRPVVSTTITGIPEIVVHEETGLLVPPRDPDALAAAIGRIIDAPALGQRFGNSGRARVEALFDIRKNVASYERLFRSP